MTAFEISNILCTLSDFVQCTRTPSQEERNEAQADLKALIVELKKRKVIPEQLHWKPL
jgi:hypothetical protein